MLVSGEIVLLDSIGELASVYSLASVAVVGGSLVPAGGHNHLEPAQYGVPVENTMFDSPIDNPFCLTTNLLIADHTHPTTAGGLILGGGHHTLKVAVDMEPLI